MFPLMSEWARRRRLLEARLPRMLRRISSPVNLLSNGTIYREPANGMSRFSEMTIKELIMEALRIKPLTATSELIELICERFGRRVIKIVLDLNCLA